MAKRVSWGPLALVGFGLGCGLSPWLKAGLVLGLLALGVALAVKRWRAFLWALPALAFAAGLSWGGLRLSPRAPDPLVESVRSAEGPVFAWVRGTVEDSEPWQDGSRLTLRTTHFKTSEEWQPCSCSVRTYLPVPPPVEGSALEASLRLTRPAPRTNPGQFDMAAYLARRGIQLTASCKSEALVRTSPAPKWALLPRYRQALESQLTRDCGEGRGAILALLLGKRGLMAEEKSEVLRRSGLYHLVALSGFQVGLLLFLLAGLAHAARWHPARRDLCGLVLILIYGLLVASSPSLNRALVMGVLFLMARLLGRPQAGLLAWCASFALLLAIEPLWLQDTGFQLTYAATLGILALWDAYPRILPQEGVFASLLRLLWVGFSAQLATLPILALDFNRISLFGWLATPLASLPAMAIQALGVPYMLGLAFVPGIHQALGWALEKLAWAFLWLPDVLGRSGWGSPFIPIPWAGWLCAYVLSLLLLAIPGKPRRGGALLVPLVTLAAWAFPQPFRGPLPEALAVLDVGQASCQVLTSGDRAVLIDAGNGNARGASSGRTVIEPFLARMGIRQLSAIVVTHWDSDHAGAAADLMEDLRVGMLVFPATDPPVSGSPLRLADLARDRGASLVPLSRGGVVSGGGFRLEALNPAEPATQTAENDRSLVLRLTWPGPVTLFSGDLQRTGEAELLREGLLNRTDVLLVPHHGSKSSSSSAWVTRAAPKIAVFSVGRGNRFGQPHPEVVERYRAAGARTLRTDHDGALLILAGQRSLVYAMRDGDWSGWFGGNNRGFSPPIRTSSGSPARP